MNDDPSNGFERPRAPPELWCVPPPNLLILPPRPRPVQFAMTPNSAGAERVFLLLKNMFPKECNLSLADLIEGSLMLKYNNAKRAAEKLAARA